MSKNIVFVVFVGLLLFMILDFFFVFPNIVKGIFYGGSFFIGAIIWYFNYYKPNLENKKIEKTEG